MEQTERAFQKQPQIFLNHKKLATDKKPRSTRFVKSIGLGFKTPKEAINEHYIDKKCPYTGTVSIRGKILTGTVLKMKMKNTAIVRRDYLHFIKKYRRYEKRHKNISVHVSPCFRGMKVGDSVVVGQCRPLSKTVRFNVIRVVLKNEGKKEFAKF